MLTRTEIDDESFVNLISHFVGYYLNACQPPRACIVHIDNWFGDRWLGFQGKILGAAGVRNRNVNDCQLPIPPFKPSRVISALEFRPQSDGQYKLTPKLSTNLHANKRGDTFWYFTHPGLYCWYSGGTTTNTNGSLMIYDVTAEGSSGWYIGFTRKDLWQPIVARNISLEECNTVMKYTAQETDRH